MIQITLFRLWEHKVPPLVSKTCTFSKTSSFLTKTHNNKKWKECIVQKPKSKCGHGEKLNFGRDLMLFETLGRNCGESTVQA